MFSGEKSRRGEFALIDWIEQQAGSSELLSLGIGDDCAIQPQQAGMDLLTSTDLLIEGVHFKCEWTDFFSLGAKSAAVNLSDIAAMGGRAQSIFLGLARPATLNDSAVEELIKGFVAEAARYGVVLAGGDTCSSPGPLMVSVTVQGAVPAGTAIRRDGAQPGDWLYVSGTLGDSALALHALQAGETARPALARRFHRPTARIELGRYLAENRLATAMLDVSDGLLGDLNHILEASAVGAEVQLQQLPLSADFAELLSADESMIDLALSGGEDYELLFTSAHDELEHLSGLPETLTRIGRITSERKLLVLAGDGSHYQCQRGGFDHFA